MTTFTDLWLTKLWLGCAFAIPAAMALAYYQPPGHYVIALTVLCINGAEYVVEKCPGIVTSWKA